VCLPYRAGVQAQYNLLQLYSFKSNIATEFKKVHQKHLTTNLSSWSPISFPGLPTLPIVYWAFLVSYMPSWSLGSPTYSCPAWSPMLPVLTWSPRMYLNVYACLNSIVSCVSLVFYVSLALTLYAYLYGLLCLPSLLYMLTYNLLYAL